MSKEIHFCIKSECLLGNRKLSKLFRICFIYVFFLEFFETFENTLTDPYITCMLFRVLVKYSPSEWMYEHINGFIKTMFYFEEYIRTMAVF